MKSIPIVFASDEKYIAPTYIAILSALINKKHETIYNFYILCPDNISNIAKQILINIEKKFDTSINIINMGNRFDDIEMKIDHITSPTYYRLCLPDILSHEDKCIYLDSDIIIRSDLSELYNIDMEDNYIGGVLSEGIILDKVYARELCKRIGLCNVSTYINAGVLILNLKKIRKSQIGEKWITLASKSFPAQDQDVLNLTCFGKIKILPLKYNLMTKCHAVKSSISEISDEVYPIDDIKQARQNPVIIHYADRIKPWNDENSVLSCYWWEMYRIIDDENAKAYVNEGIDKLRESITVTKKKWLRNKAIRFTQILGIYALLKKIEDIFKGQ